MEYKLQGWCRWNQRIIYNSSRLVKYSLRISIVEGNSDKNKRVLYLSINIGNCDDRNFRLAECISFLPFLGTHVDTNVSLNRGVGRIPKNICRSEVCSFYAGWQCSHASWNNCTLLRRWQNF